MLLLFKKPEVVSPKSGYNRISPRKDPLVFGLELMKMTLQLRGGKLFNMKKYLITVSTANIKGT